MSHNNDHEHITPYKTYVIVWLVLMVFTIITVTAARQDFGSLNLIIAMVIASIKATVVALWFMHLKFEDSITWVFALYPLFLLGLLIGLTSVDVFNRVVP
jgi:cytochrome c oxidase subunit IV